MTDKKKAKTKKAKPVVKAEVEKEVIKEPVVEKPESPKVKPKKLTLESLQAQIDNQSATIRRHSKHYVEHVRIGHTDEAGPNGKVGGFVKDGFVNIGQTLMVAFVSFCVLCGSVFSDENVGSAGFSNAVEGVMMVTTDGAGTATLRGDAIVISGAITAGGALTAAVIGNTQNATTNITLTSANYGQVIMLTSNDVIDVTLPANGAAAGTWIDVMTGATSTDSCAPTISSATTDTLVGAGDQDLKSVTWGSGERIGAYARFISDGAFWHVQDLGSTTISYTD